MSDEKWLYEQDLEGFQIIRVWLDANRKATLSRSDSMWYVEDFEPSLASGLYECRPIAAAMTLKELATKLRKRAER